MFTRYKHLAIDDFAGKPTPSEIEAIERKLEAKLPPDFVAFLDVANGGYLDYCIRVPPSPEGEVLSFCGLYSTKPDSNGHYGHETFLGEIEFERRYKNIPKGVLPFARDGGSSVVYLDLTPEGAGRVVAFVHGLPSWTGLRQDDAYIEVAKSFAEFVDLLYVDLDEAKELLEDALIEQDQERITAIKEFLDISAPGWQDKIGLGS